MSTAAPIHNITPKDLSKRLQAGEAVTLIDVREDFEREICSIGGIAIPKDTIEENLYRIPKEGTVVIYCRSGGRSGAVVRILQNNYGYNNLLNLEGGILRWSDEVDSTIAKY